MNILKILLFPFAILLRIVSGSRNARQYETLTTLTYEDAIRWIANNKPNRPFDKAAIMRSKASGELIISLVFLDQQDRIISKSNGQDYGRFIKCQQLDAELEEAFGNMDLIIVT